MTPGAAQSGETIKARIRATIEKRSTELIALADAIHDAPEVAFEEHRSARLVASALESQKGFDVQLGAFDLETSLLAQAGSGPLWIALCAEYDALPDIGHACGHNIIAAAAVGAAWALSEFTEDLGIGVRLLGTPAEEVGDAGGKILMLDRGAWDGMHLSMMVHPGPFDDLAPPLIAISAFQVEYHGKEVHATTFSHLGINAGAAATIAQVSIAELRQQLKPQQRVHGIVEKFGSSANTLSGYSRLRYMIRSGSIEDLEELRVRVMRCFEAGAVATGARMEVLGGTMPYAPLVSDTEAAKLFGKNVSDFSPRRFPKIGHGPSTFAGTDMGNVSVAVPTIHPMLGLGCFPIVNHQAEFTSVCRTQEAYSALVDGAYGMAATAVDVATSEAQRRRLLKR